MNVRLLPQRDGEWRASWYGEYEENGKKRAVNLNIPWRGTPPASGKLRDPGDTAFERSRAQAEEALARHVDEIRHKGRAEHLTEKLIQSKTGRAVEYVTIQDLPTRWRAMGRDNPAGERYLLACDAHFRRFADFMGQRNRTARHLYEVTPDDAAAFMAAIQNILARKTCRDAVKLLNKAFASFLPVGASSPFAAFMRRRTNGNGEGTFHRAPFSADELHRLLEAARDDEDMHGPIVCAACTGMRRGDVCALRWPAVDLPGGMLTVKTSKTGATVEIPIFPPLRAIFDATKGERKGYVFPAAARMLRDNPDGLTWRFKKIVARALADALPPPALPAVAPVDAKAAREAILAALPAGGRCGRILDSFERYMAGASVREIEKATGRGRSSISGDLHTVEDIIGGPVLRHDPTTPSVKRAVRELTQRVREDGQRAASVRDWHALRATWVTLALSAGVPVELVRRVTGHGTVEVILRHYFKPGREQFRAVLAGAMPAVLTGNQKKLEPADELAALAGRVAAGTATEQEKKRLRVLAAKV